MREYRKGTYTILDTKGFPAGERVELWHGMWTKKETNTPEMKARFESRRHELNLAIENLFSTFRIFVAPIEVERRVLARIEAALNINRSYKAGEWQIEF